MRYRKLDTNGDYTFGQSQQNFYLNDREAVAQAIKTRLGLLLGEWFLDITDGTNWQQGVFGRYTENTRDDTIRSRINGTPGVLSIDSFSSDYDGINRTYSVEASVSTIYGQVIIQESI